jgi:hypothetical protein
LGFEPLHGELEILDHFGSRHVWEAEEGIVGSSVDNEKGSPELRGGAAREGGEGRDLVKDGGDGDSRSGPGVALSERIVGSCASGC